MTSHVQVRAIPPRIKYVANGTMMEYEFPFVIFKTSDIDVYFNDKLQEKSTYTVSTIPDTEGGSIIFETPPINGTVITIFRNLSIERTTDFQEGGTLRAKVLNDELDYQIACQQQIADSLNRSMVLPPYATDTDVDLTLPTPSAGKAIVWNEDGTNLENSVVKINELEGILKDYKESAEHSSVIADEAAKSALQQAIEATKQADIATQKATETIVTLSDKASKDMDNISPKGEEFIIRFCIPDYTAGISKAWDTEVVAECAGVIIAHDMSQQSTTIQAVVNGNTLPFNEIAHSGLLTISFVVGKGDVWKVYGGDNSARNLMFYPMKGVSNA